jgi:hypothetical protein
MWHFSQISVIGSIKKPNKIKNYIIFINIFIENYPQCNYIYFLNSNEDLITTSNQYNYPNCYRYKQNTIYDRVSKLECHHRNNLNHKKRIFIFILTNLF